MRIRGLGAGLAVGLLAVTGSAAVASGGSDGAEKTAPAHGETRAAHGGSADAARSRRRPCTRRGSTTLAQSRTVRVYDGGNERLYGCLKRQDKRRLLTTFSEIDDAITSVRTAGTHVVWRHIQGPGCRADCPPDVTDVSIVSLMNLRNTRARRVEASPTAGLRLSSAGVAAWVEGAPPTTTVRALSRFGAVDLDTGDIQPRSLRLRGATVSWERDGERHSATVRR